MHRGVGAAFVAALALLAAVPAQASAGAQYGIQDDAWLMYGPGTLSQRLSTLEGIGVGIVRFTVRWDQIAPTKPASPRDPSDSAYRWGAYGEVLEQLHERGIPTLVTLYGSPRWANGGASANHLPASGFGDFAYAAAVRYPWVRRWTVWNEPNSRTFGRGETPFRAACIKCGYFTMASLARIRSDVTRYLGSKPLWLTEYGYQTNPPDRLLGVSSALQAKYIGEAGLRVWQQPGVTILIQFLVRDEPSLGGWQSGLFSAGGQPKLAYHAFALPLAQVTRHGARVALWGQVRPGHGARAYVLQRGVGSGWRAVGGTAQTGATGTFSRTVVLSRGARVRIWAPAVGWASPALTLS